MAIEDIGKNALQVLEKRYLAKDAEGNHTEDVAGLFRRVAAAVAAAVSSALPPRHRTWRSCASE